MTYFFFGGLAIAVFLAGFLVREFFGDSDDDTGEEAGASLPLPEESLEELGAKLLPIVARPKKPFVVYQGETPLCVISAETTEEAHAILKFDSGRFTFSLKIRESTWGIQESLFIPFHRDWVEQMDRDLAASRASLRQVDGEVI